MAITRPVTKTIISSPGWGIPITDEVNALRTELNALKPTSWTALPFANGYGNQTGAYVPARYRKVGDMVQVYGVMSGPPNQASNFAVAFTLPVGYRPTAQFYAYCASWNNSLWQLARVSILPDGGHSFEFHSGQYVALNYQFPTT